MTQLIQSLPLSFYCYKSTTKNIPRNSCSIGKNSSSTRNSKQHVFLLSFGHTPYWVTPLTNTLKGNATLPVTEKAISEIFKQLKKTYTKRYVLKRDGQ
ncbi:unnamed protein product [Triticum turgidum subsp. durum]|uniref:Uncharacterized protein n=1 Tax=Triticum turgidum subsp. durum TaxID=4567 RepID=A0A9R0V9A6_TRITD|nr:unnamed protein product [Triticum turgidum subsp. durum]